MGGFGRRSALACRSRHQACARGASHNASRYMPRNSAATCRNIMPWPAASSTMPPAVSSTEEPVMPMTTSRPVPRVNMAAIAMTNSMATRFVNATTSAPSIYLSFRCPTLVQCCTARRFVPTCLHLRAPLPWGAQGWPFVTFCHDHASPPRLLWRNWVTPAPCTSSTRLSAAT